MRLGLTVVGIVLMGGLPGRAAFAQRRPAARPVQSVATPVVAPERSPQEQHFERGHELMAQRRTRDALTEFEAACSPERRPPCVWFQIVALDALRERLRAAELFTVYDALATGRPDDYDVVRTRVMGGVGRLRVIPEGEVPAGVAFLLDGTPLRGAQVGGDAVYVLPGERVVEARGEGREPVRLAVTVAAGADRSVSVPIPEERVPVTRRWWFWTGIAVVVAGGVTAAVLLSTQDAPTTERTRPPSPLLGTGFQVIRSVP